MREYEHLDVSIQADVFRIAFDRPDRKNAINEAVQQEFAGVWQDAEVSEARVVLITGNGDAFCAGGDTEAMEDAFEAGAGREGGPAMPALQEGTFMDAIRLIERTIDGIIDIHKPVIARVNGDAVGFGASIALLSDIAIASTDARVGDPHVGVGISAPVGPMLWPLLTDMHTAKEYLMTGDIMDAETAAEVGLVNRAVPPEELDDEVDEMINKLASGPQPAIQYTKVALNNWLEWAAKNMLRESLLFEGLSQAQPDHEEAVQAFLEKREPSFPTGRSREE